MCVCVCVLQYTHRKKDPVLTGSFSMRRQRPRTHSSSSLAHSCFRSPASVSLQPHRKTLQSASSPSPKIHRTTLAGYMYVLVWRDSDWDMMGSPDRWRHVVYLHDLRLHDGVKEQIVFADLLWWDTLGHSCRHLVVVQKGQKTCNTKWLPLFFLSSVPVKLYIILCV